MNLKRLTVAGFYLMILPFGFCLTSQKVNAQQACGVNDSRQGRRGVVEYYYIPNPNRSGEGRGCSPQYGGRWHRYYGNPGSGGVWQIVGTAVLFRSIYTYSEIRPVSAVDALPIRVSR